MPTSDWLVFYPCLDKSPSAADAVVGAGFLIAFVLQHFVHVQLVFNAVDPAMAFDSVRKEAKIRHWNAGNGPVLAHVVHESIIGVQVFVVVGGVLVGVLVVSASAARPLAAVLRVPLAHVFVKFLLPLLLSNLILLALIKELIDLRRQ